MRALIATIMLAAATAGAGEDVITITNTNLLRFYGTNYCPPRMEDVGVSNLVVSWVVTTNTGPVTGTATNQQRLITMTRYARLTGMWNDYPFHVDRHALWDWKIEEKVTEWRSRDLTIEEWVPVMLRQVDEKWTPMNRGVDGEASE